MYLPKPIQKPNNGAYKNCIAKIELVLMFYDSEVAKLTDDVGSDSDGNECLVRMEGSSMRLIRYDATSYVTEIKML